MPGDSCTSEQKLVSRRSFRELQAACDVTRDGGKPHYAAFGGAAKVARPEAVAEAQQVHGSTRHTGDTEQNAKQSGARKRATAH